MSVSPEDRQRLREVQIGQRNWASNWVYAANMSFALLDALEAAEARLKQVTLPDGLKAALVHRILRELVEDNRYPCHCGSEPYTDGDTCLKCAALAYLETPCQS